MSVALQRAVTDVGAVLHAVEADLGDGGVRGALRLAQRIAERRDAEHAAAADLDLRRPTASVPAWNTVTSGCVGGVTRSSPSMASPRRGASG